MTDEEIRGKDATELPLVEQLLQRIAAAVQADRATLSRVDGEWIIIEGSVDAGGEPAVPGKRWLITDPEFRSLLARRAVTVQSYNPSVLPEPFREQLTSVRHSATVPLVLDATLLGTIVVSRRQARPFDDTDLATLKELGNVVVLVLQNFALTDRAQKADAELRTSEERFRLLVDGVKDYAIFMLDTTGHITSWNQGAERIKGYRAEEIIGQHFSVFYPPESVAAGDPMRGLDEAKREGRFEAEGWRVRKDGTRFWASVVITALRGEAGDLRGFGKVTRDITERKRVQDRLLEAERQEAARFHELADQLASLERTKSEFLKLASHELRTPVSVIRGYLSLFAEGDLGSLNEHGSRALTVMRAQARELTFLIGQMLEAARLQQGIVSVEVRELDIREVMAEAVAWAQELASVGHELVLVMPKHPVHVVADPGRTMTILQSLLDNAVKYSPEGGRISCEVAVEKEFAVLKVVDAGIGIGPQQLEQLFHPFGRVVTVDTADIGGAGLGLYLARELARLQAGDITVVSDHGVGSTFALRLRRVEATERPGRARRARALRATGPVH